MSQKGAKIDASGEKINSIRLVTDADANAGLGDVLDPIRVDPTGTTVQPVSFSTAQHVIVDSGGGGGTQYADGTTQATPTGTVALGKNASNVLHSLSLDASNNLNVNLAAGSISGGNAAASATGSAVPASADYTGFNSGGNLVGVSSVNPLPVTGTVTDNQGTPNSAANAWPVKVTDGTNVSAVKAASTAAAATDPALVVAVSPNNSVTVAQATAANLNANVSGTVTSNQGTANSLANAWSMKVTDATNGPAAVKAASTAAVAADPALVVTLSPNNSVVVTQATAANLLTKANIVGHAGNNIDGTITPATAPPNALAVLGVYNSTAPAPTTGQAQAVQTDASGNVFVNHIRRSQVKIATGSIASTTPATMLAAQAAGVFADLAGLVLTIGGETTAAYMTVNISDGTNTYKFALLPEAVGTAGGGTNIVSVNFDPPIPATTAATAWTIAVSVADATVFYVATFINQLAS